MSSRALTLATVMLLIGCLAADQAQAQATNLEAGKSPSQIFGSIRRRPQLAPTIATSVIAATAWDQLASSSRIPRTSNSSPVPTMLAATPLQKAMPVDQIPTR